MLLEFWDNFRHNLFKPLLLFFYFGFLMRSLRVKFEFPPVVYQGLTMYLLLAIGWRGGEELAAIEPSSIGGVLGFVVVGFAVNLAIGFIAYLLLTRMTRLRRIDKATIAGYYGSDSAGTFATCVGVLASVGMAFDAYMPVMLAVMEIPGCLVALYLAARLRHRGLDADGYMPDERRKTAVSASLGAAAGRAGTFEIETAPRRRQQPRPVAVGQGDAHQPLLSAELLREVLLNPGLCLLFGGITIGLISGLQGDKVVHDANSFFVAPFQGALCLFLLEMGMTAAQKMKDLRFAGRGFIAFGLVAPNIFAMLGIIVAHAYASVTDTAFAPGTYLLFAVLCGAASYIAVPAVQRLAIPEASPSLPLAASLALTFSYNVTVGIPLYMELSHIVQQWFPV